MSERYPMNDFVRRILLRRLALVAAAVSLVLGVSTWFAMRDQVKEDVAELAFERLAVVKAGYQRLRAEGLAEEIAVARAIEELADYGYRERRGRFVYADFYDELGSFHVVKDTTGLGDDAAEIAERYGRPMPGPGEDRRRLVRLDGKPAVHVVLPIEDRSGQIVSWVSAVHPLNPEMRARLTREPLTTVGLVILVVMVISGLFYPIVLRFSDRMAEFSSDLLEANLEMMEALGSAVAKRDSDTDAHNYRVTIYAVRLAEKEGLGNRAMQGLIKGAFLHDVGKIGIRDEVLLKPGRLDEDEYEVMKTHVEHGLDIVGRASWLRDALGVVGSHHEKYDGQGYPGRVPGEMIPLAARIFAIADVFDALSSKRPYKDPMPLEKVFEILEEGRGTHFDPAVLDSFLEIAPDLHAHLDGRPAEELREELQEIIQKYFTAGLRVLLA